MLLAMYEGRASSTDDPYALPGDAETRRMAIATLSHRAIARKREVQLNDVLGDDDAGLLADLMATLTNETAFQLELTARLLRAGWAWERILEAVWYNEDALRAAANAG